MSGTRRLLAWPLGVLALYYAVLTLAPGRQAGALSGQPRNECDRFTVQPRDHSPDADVPSLERCAAADPDDEGLMRELGYAYEDREDWTAAERWFRRALAVDAHDGDVHLHLGRLLLRRHDSAGALEQATAGLQSQPGRAEILSLAREASAR